MGNGGQSYDTSTQQQQQQQHPPQQRQYTSVPDQSMQKPLLFKKGRPRNIQPLHSEPDYGQCDFFGSKSAGSFVQQIRAAISAKGNTPSPGQNTPVVSGSPLPQLPTMQPKTRNGPSVDYVLPSRKVADGLLDVYWNAVHPLYPFLDRQQFQRMYEGTWAGEPSESDESLMMCTLNVVFALASQFSDSLAPKERETSARRYFDRAQDLLNLDLWDIGSVQLVQCLLLMGQYLQSTNSPHQAWMVTGLTVRIAEGLGLHLPETSVRIDDVHLRELVRRLWHGCVVMDRILSMQFNRPAMVDKLGSNSVPLPNAVDDEHMDRGQPSDCPPVIAFYIKTLEVFEIMAKVMKNSASLNRGVGTHTSRDQYNLLFGDSNINHLTETLQLDQSLMIWASSLPSHLRSDCTSSANPYNAIFHRQANVLRSRYLHSRILLFRPILSRFCLAQPDTTHTSSSSDMEHESLPQHLALACSNLCLRAAHDAIHLIYSNLDRENITGPVPQWWNCILFTYSAATVLQAARLRPMGSPNYNIDTSWNHALEIIRSFEPLSPLVQRCVLALEILADKITETTDATNHTAAPTASTTTAGPSSTLRPNSASVPTAKSMPTPNAQRWAEKDGPSPASAPPPTPGGAVEAANALLPGMGESLDAGGADGGGTMGFDFDLNDMSWLTSAPVNL
ncbi:hypothetical protein GJ744_009735 [Endocarpon pusillum]|uniref:Xylanolytic transcriptional activator regulatory domain-containing protein n=1 Tax=Endocarpon pusillum TaxID=364733 RepID=A0A8H7AS20_9EURO|nr:hypothetical protein GJ744_009735 [Endocarpon pusillum]